MIYVNDLVKTLKDNIIIIINLGPDENNFARQVIYHENEHGHLIIDEIYFADEKNIGIKVL